ncbi:hypothetical protein [Alkalicoccus luteus]|uniref:Uncharacterized protein n=1 Tax=Alkalicoccus luteus TaxID=1237094 RepID=A0A969TUL9_9BACI|nr:hypothetical protein [Alkalicoccus luteus]NJP37207.1 hypothetical protein [Alkalicoccus luteus]
MKNVMTRAWRIAKDGQAQFGGSVKEYFAQSLVISWDIEKRKNEVSDQEKEVIKKGFAAYEKFVQDAIARGAKLVAKNENEYVLNHKGNEMRITPVITRGTQDAVVKFMEKKGAEKRYHLAV